MDRKSNLLLSVYIYKFVYVFLMIKEAASPNIKNWHATWKQVYRKKEFIYHSQKGYLMLLYWFNDHLNNSLYLNKSSEWLYCRPACKTEFYQYNKVIGIVRFIQIW